MEDWPKILFIKDVLENSIAISNKTSVGYISKGKPFIKFVKFESRQIFSCLRFKYISKLIIIEEKTCQNCIFRRC